MRQKGVLPDKHTFPLLLKTFSKSIGHDMTLLLFMHRKFQEGLRAFWDMILDNVAPNDFTLLSVLSVCARMGALDQGRLIGSSIH